MLAGHPTITGFVLSLTMTLKLQVAVFPEPSMAIYVTSVVPIGKVLPGAFVLVNVEREQLSEAVGGVQVATASQDPFAVSRTLDGQPVIVGVILSFTVTVNEQVEIFPVASVAV